MSFDSYTTLNIKSVLFLYARNEQRKETGTISHTFKTIAPGA